MSNTILTHRPLRVSPALSFGKNTHADYQPSVSSYHSHCDYLDCSYKSLDSEFMIAHRARHLNKPGFRCKCDNCKTHRLHAVQEDQEDQEDQDDRSVSTPFNLADSILFAEQYLTWLTQRHQQKQQYNSDVQAAKASAKYYKKPEPDMEEEDCTHIEADITQIKAILKQTRNDKPCEMEEADEEEEEEEEQEEGEGAWPTLEESAMDEDEMMQEYSKWKSWSF